MNIEIDTSPLVDSKVGTGVLTQTGNLALAHVVEVGRCEQDCAA